MTTRDPFAKGIEGILPQTSRRKKYSHPALDKARAERLAKEAEEKAKADEAKKRTEDNSSKPKKQPPKCSECGSSAIDDSDGTRTCMNCGTVIPSSNIVSEVTFAESSAGAPVVQGAYVGEGKTHAKSFRGPGNRHHESTDSREVSEAYGKSEIERQGVQLGLADNVRASALQIYKLATGVSFVQGRRISNVAAVCLYIACRRDTSSNTALLIDFAELQQVNVYKLGQVYTDLKAALFLDDAHNSTGPRIEPERLIEKYCGRLEFGPAALKVAADANRIMKRMDRDWIATGRLPSGLCGACIVLAARMNNFRRSVREVVYVVKVCDMTLQLRIDEFSRTESSKLSVKDFRENWNRLHDKAEPPVFYYQEKAKAKAAKKRRRLLADSQADGDVVVVVDDQGSAQSTPSGTPEQEVRTDADGFKIPPRPIPIDPSLDSTAPVNQDGVADENDPSNNTRGKKRKRKSGRTGREEVKQPLILTEEHLKSESAMIEEVEQIVNDPMVLNSIEDVKLKSLMDRAKEAADDAKDREAAKREDEERRQRKRRAQGESTSELSPGSGSQSPSPAVEGTAADGENTPESASADHLVILDEPGEGRTPSLNRARTIEESIDDEEVDLDQYADDLEVTNCLLSQEEQEVRETIWVNDNQEWLRRKQARVLKVQLQEAYGLNAQGNKRKRGKADEYDENGKKKKRRRYMGDGSTVEDPQDQPKDAAEAVARMLQKANGSKSRSINYSRLKELYVPKSRKDGEAYYDAVDENGNKVNATGVVGIFESAKNARRRSSQNSEASIPKRRKSSTDRSRSISVAASEVSEAVTIGDSEREETPEYLEEEVAPSGKQRNGTATANRTTNGRKKAEPKTRKTPTNVDAAKLKKKQKEVTPQQEELGEEQEPQQQGDVVQEEGEENRDPGFYGPGADEDEEYYDEEDGGGEEEDDFLSRYRRRSEYDDYDDYGGEEY